VHDVTRAPAAAYLSARQAVLIAGCALLAMAILAGFAQFAVLKTLIVPTDAAATIGNLRESEGLFRGAIAAFFAIVVLDVVVAWALYVLLRPVDRSLALLTAWLRLAFAAVFAYCLVNLLNAAQLLGSNTPALQGEQLSTQVMVSLAAFNSGWTGIALGIFGLHLLALAYLLYRLPGFPWLLAVLVAIAGAGYTTDALGTVLVPNYSLTVAAFTFVGEALLIPWFLWMAYQGVPNPLGDTDVAQTAAGAAS
jgi:hypothetical protein